MTKTVGRFAPSPSGDMHVGNIRTALLAWLFARAAGGDFVMRVEDLDRVKEGAAESQLTDLASIGIDWDGAVLHQTERFAAYEEAIESLRERGMVYECFCTRKEIQAAASAPHAAPGAYPGTCRNLTDEEREEKRATRNPALRIRADVVEFTVHDYYAGDYTGMVDDFVLRRTDGVPAYNLAVVVDDHFQGVNQVVRGDDLLSSAPRQAYLAQLLGYEIPEYVHVPLVLGMTSQRLAKRDGAVTLAQLKALGIPQEEVMRLIASSLNMAPIEDGDSVRLPQTAQEMLSVFKPEALPRTPWTFIDPTIESVCCLG